MIFMESNKQNYSYEYDANGNVEQIDETIDGESFTTTQGFDDLERMTSKTDRYGNSFQ
ncbi:MAG: hypothetical protein KDI59_09955, partial [Xanthomonadales bacterium]|nr:hypothetical protein [Xanthomonadales bacterium]